MSDPAVIAPISIARPQSGEYAPYYERYISLVSGTDILGTLESQRRQMLLLLSGRDESEGDFRYAPEKWTRKRSPGTRLRHRAHLRLSRPAHRRGDRTAIEGFEQDDYVRNGPSREPLPEIIDDYIAVRRATLTLLRNLDEQAWIRRGVVNNNEVTVRALAYTSPATNSITAASWKKSTSPATNRGYLTRVPHPSCPMREGGDFTSRAREIRNPRAPKVESEDPDCACSWFILKSAAHSSQLIALRS